jgi:hypothetical protein
MMAGLSPAVAATAHYEAMRAWVLAGRAPTLSPAGVVVVLRRGMAAWLAIILTQQPAPPAPSVPAVPTEQSTGDTSLVTLLATMIEHVQHTEERT